MFVPDNLCRLETIELLLEDDLVSTKQWKKAISKCGRIGIKNLVFNLKHNTPRKDLLELIEYSQNFNTKLIIDGVFLSRPFCEKLKEANIKHISTTLYSFLAVCHGTVSNDDSFSKIVMGIKNAIQYGLDINIDIPVCRINYKSVNATLQYLYELGVRSTNITVYMEGTAFFKNQPLDEQELIKMLEEAIPLVKSLPGLSLTFDSPSWIRELELFKLQLPTPTCKACLKRMCILSNGDVVPCSAGIAVNTVLGNIFYSSWNKIKSGYDYKAIRQHSYESPEECPFLRFSDTPKCTEQR